LNLDHASTFTALNPSLTLQLRINHERESRAVGYNRTILHGDSISWETFCLPSGLNRSIRQDFKWIDSISKWNLVFRDDLWKNQWLEDIKKNKIPFTDGVDPLEVLSNASI
jgi:hypothetical protein